MTNLAVGSVVVVFALAVLGCGSSRSASGKPSLNGLPKSLRAFVRSSISPTTGNTVDSYEIYGPGSRAALSEAASGGTLDEKGNGYYLLVLHGHLVANGPIPLGAAEPTGTTETLVWSPQSGVADLGITHSVPPAILRLHKLAAVTIS